MWSDGVRGLDSVLGTVWGGPDFVLRAPGRVMARSGGEGGVGKVNGEKDEKHRSGLRENSG